LCIIVVLLSLLLLSPGLQQNGLGYDYLWAHGRHPFGPFAAGPECSQLLLDAAARNAVLARLHSAYASALRSVEALRGLFLALLPAEQLRAALSALGLAGGAEQRLGIRALWALHPDGLATQKTKDAVAWLFAQLGELEARFAKVHGSIRALALAAAGACLLVFAWRTGSEKAYGNARGGAFAGVRGRMR
jgi:hypothetical protein